MKIPSFLPRHSSLVGATMTGLAVVSTGGAQAQSFPTWTPFGSSPEQTLSAASYVPKTAFFLGLGGSFNSVNFNNEYLYAQGVSNIYLDGAMVANGSAGGPVGPHLNTKPAFGPIAQVGYVQNFAGSDYLWGVKFSYAYLGTNYTDKNVLVPQVGSFTSSNSSSFTGNVYVRSYQSAVTHQMLLTPFLGRSFERAFVYAGAGSALSQIRTKLNGVIGFAAIDNSHENITGTPSDFSSGQWLVGGAAVAGVTYFFAPSWFVDLSYTFTMTKVPTVNYSAYFASATSGYTDTGVLSGNYSGRVMTQAFKLSLNRTFDLY